MFTTLIESKPRRQRRTGGALLSVLVHLSLIAGAAAATRSVASGTTAAPHDTVIVVYHPPQDPSPPAPLPHRAEPAGPTLPGPTVPPFVFRTKIDHVLPPIDGISYPGNVDSLVAAGGNVDLGRGVLGTGDTRGASDVFLPDQVEKGIATLTAPTPLYPEMLRASGIEGRVVVRFVVDTAGRIEPATLEVRESTHDLFTRAVRDALPRFRFAAAESNGHRVRVLVEMPFEFTLGRR